MNIVLVCANNFQEYILINIEQLIRLKHTSIYVLTNGCFFDKFQQFANSIKLINIDELNDIYQYDVNSKQNNSFRNGFWRLTSSRFFYIYAFMEKHNIQNVIHLENDVLIYYNCDILMPNISDHIYLPFDTFKRNIASIMYIPNSGRFKQALDHFDFAKNDMENFSNISQQTGIIKNFPIFITDETTPEHKFVTNNYDKFQYIFDAAAMGQYLGGVDPIHNWGDSRGFVNETCIIKYNNYRFSWTDAKPFININGKLIPIFNLHIHCKELDKFI